MSNKKRLWAAIFCFFFGVLGIHRFYAGKVSTGIIQLLTLGFFGVWAVIDFITILAGEFRDKDEQKILEWV